MINLVRDNKVSTVYIVILLHEALRLSLLFYTNASV